MTKTIEFFGRANNYYHTKKEVNPGEFEITGLAQGLIEKEDGLLLDPQTIYRVVKVERRNHRGDFSGEQLVYEHKYKGKGENRRIDWDKVSIPLNKVPDTKQRFFRALCVMRVYTIIPDSGKHFNVPAVDEEQGRAIARRMFQQEYNMAVGIIKNKKKVLPTKRQLRDIKEYRS